MARYDEPAAPEKDEEQVNKALRNRASRLQPDEYGLLPIPESQRNYPQH